MNLFIEHFIFSSKHWKANRRLRATEWTYYYYYRYFFRLFFRETGLYYCLRECHFAQGYMLTAKKYKFLMNLDVSLWTDALIFISIFQRVQTRLISCHFLLPWQIVDNWYQSSQSSRGKKKGSPSECIFYKQVLFKTEISQIA